MSTKEKEQNHETAKSKSKCKQKSNISTQNPLLDKHQKFISKIPKDVKDNFFSSKVSHEERAELLTSMCEEGESLVNLYSWAIPNTKCLNILNHFAPIIEIGCGKNAYWSKLMFDYGIDAIAYDIDLEDGGQINHSRDEKKPKKKQKIEQPSSEKSNFLIQKGGPEVLISKESSERTLFLCYPDERYDDDGSSLGISCLSKYEGKYVIHVGELYGSHGLSIDQAPYGRSSSCDFQDYLNTYFHCLLNVRIPNWIHVNDTLSVWKRSELCAVVYADDDEEGEKSLADNDDISEEDIAQYKFIPVDERLPVDVAAPCVCHLLQCDEANNVGNENSSSS